MVFEKFFCSASFSAMNSHLVVESKSGEEMDTCQGGYGKLEGALIFKPSRGRTREDLQQKYFAVMKCEVCAIFGCKI